VIYYSWSFFIIYFSIIFIIRTLNFLFFIKYYVLSILLPNSLSIYLIFTLYTLWIIYLILETAYSFQFYFSSILEYLDNSNSINKSNSNVLGIEMLQIYYFPFIYVFVFVTTLSIAFCLSYSFNEVMVFILYCTAIWIAGYSLFFSDSLIIFFFSYEMLLIPSFFILYKFAKTRRCVEAAYLMFFWTQFGALVLIFSFLYLFATFKNSSFYNICAFEFTTFEANFLFACWIAGFGVKFPVWPFYGWLPKAHVEASTNFSIFLSGVLVKFAFFGLLKCLTLLQSEPGLYYVYPFLLIGIIDAVFKLFYQIDLKKLVAYSTVVEMHWLTICVFSGYSCMMLASFCMLISHALLSSNSFFLVDAINRRFKTRLITEVSGINFLCPKLFLVSLLNCLVFLGFPGSIFFISEILFFSFLFDLYPLLCFVLIPLLYLLGPTFFFRSWVNVLFGLSTFVNKKIPLDLNSKELLLYSSIIFLMFWLGFTWTTFIF